LIHYHCISDTKIEQSNTILIGYIIEDLNGAFIAVVISFPNYQVDIGTYIDNIN